MPLRILIRMFAGLCLMATGVALLPIVAHAADAGADDIHATAILTAVADTTISLTTPDTPAADAKTLRVHSAGPDDQDYALVDFDLSSIPAGAVVTRAELQLFQTTALPPDLFFVDVHRITQPWGAPSTTWNKRPDSVTVISARAVTYTTNVTVPIDVTTLVQGWLHDPPANPEYGLLLAPAANGGPGDRVFTSAETDNPPRLVVDYTLTPRLVSVTGLASAPKFDGVCDTTNDYGNVTPLPYTEIDGAVHYIYLRQDATDLYVCVEGTLSSFSQRAFSLTFDGNLTNSNTEPDADDVEIKVTLTPTPTLTFTNDFDTSKWDALVALDRPNLRESAEFRVDLAAIGAYQLWCGAAFGLGVFHQDVRTVGDTYGWPPSAEVDQPNTWVETRLTNPPCPIRICMEDAGCNQPAVDANALRTSDGVSFATDESGFVLNRSDILGGDALWAMSPISVTDRYRVYATDDRARAVNFAAFNGATPGVMTLVVSEQHPLLVHDLDISAQWLLNDAQREWLDDQIHTASNVLYASSDGQILLGDVTVRQSYEGWFDADVWLYTNNNLRPRAAPGGIVETPQPDPGGTDIMYYPGYIHLGRAWNRYHRPPGEPITVGGVLIDPATLTDDWAIITAHEFGHYVLFLFDAYYGVTLEGSVVTVNSCTGSIMGWAYEQENWGYVNSPDDWATNCSETHANQLLGRNEWDVILDHFPMLQRPAEFTPGPAAPPVSLTNVEFVEPVGGAPPAGEIFDLLYEDSQTASRKALGFLIRDDYVLSQGSPPQGTTKIDVAGAQVGDRLCVYDIDAAPPGPHTPRHQYGCETVEAGDTTLNLERDDAWSPIVIIDPIGPTTIAVTVTQAVTGGNLVARVYPEHAGVSFTAALAPAGIAHSAVFTLPNVTPAAFVQVYVDETASETDPRGEAMAMYGVDGGTVPGPGSWDAKAPVYSSDGESVAWPLEAVLVQPGQRLTKQYMVETFTSPGQATRVSDAYRVISWPPELAASVMVNIRTPSSSVVQGAYLPAAAPRGLPATPNLHVRFWNGSAWQPVATDVETTQDGAYVAAAVVPADRVYALFEGEIAHYLPYARR